MTKLKYSSPREIVLRKFASGPADEYADSIETMAPGDHIIICVRVSARTSFLTHNLAEAAANLRTEVEARGGIVISPPIRTSRKGSRLDKILLGQLGWLPVAHVGSGRDPIWLARAAALAKPHDAKLLVESMNRAVRHEHACGWPVKDWKAQATLADLDGLRYVLDGAPLLTCVSPSASSEEERAYETERGERAKARARQQANRSQVAKAKAYRTIAKLTSSLSSMREIARYISDRYELPFSTARDWVRSVIHEGVDGFRNHPAKK